MYKDKLGRIARLKKSDKVNFGHSVCWDCGKDMPYCWDTICSICGKVLCYKHAYCDDEYWYCNNCKPYWAVLKI